MYEKLNNITFGYCFHPANRFAFVMVVVGALAVVANRHLIWFCKFEQQMKKNYCKRTKIDREREEEEWL